MPFYLIAAYVPPKRIRGEGLIYIFLNKELVCDIALLIDDIQLDTQFVTEETLQSLHEKQILPLVKSDEKEENLSSFSLCYLL